MFGRFVGVLLRHVWEISGAMFGVVSRVFRSNDLLEKNRSATNTQQNSKHPLAVIRKKYRGSSYWIFLLFACSVSYIALCCF